jgi:Phage tail tube protein
LSVKVNGEIVDVVGNVEYDLGEPQREALVGADRVHGFTEKPKVPYLKLEVTDRQGFDLRGFFNVSGATVIWTGRNGKGVTLSEAWYAGAGTVQSEDGKVDVVFQAMRADEFSQ